MQDTIEKILVVINECKDPIVNTTHRTLRDDMLEILGQQFYNVDRNVVESYAKNDKEFQALSWFYTRFVQIKTIGAHGKFKSRHDE